MSDVPLGFFLSGGIDSTLCAALIRKYFGKDIHSYSIGFEVIRPQSMAPEKTASIIGLNILKCLKSGCLLILSII